MNTTRQIRVVKVGGSLFDAVELPSWISTWLRRQAAATNVLVTGGGCWADAVRQLDRAAGLSNNAAHTLALRAMRLTAYLLKTLLPGAVLTDDLAHLGHADPDVWIWNPQPDPPTGRHAPAVEDLPQSWDVSSDSIAAWVALQLGAGELVLLKSSLPLGIDAHNWADQGWVDRYFPGLANQLPRVRGVNLRHPSFPEVVMARVAGG